MKLTYTPEDGDPQEWQYLARKVRAADAEALERRTSMTFREFNTGLANGSIVCLRALLWHFMRQTHHTIRFEDVDFAVGELQLEFDRSELETIRAEVVAAKLPAEAEAERAMALAQLDAQIAAAEDGEGKAPASSAG